MHEYACTLSADTQLRGTLLHLCHTPCPLQVLSAMRLLVMMQQHASGTSPSCSSTLGACSTTNTMQSVNLGPAGCHTPSSAAQVRTLLDTELRYVGPCSLYRYIDLVTALLVHTGNHYVCCVCGCVVRGSALPCTAAQVDAGTPASAPFPPPTPTWSDHHCFDHSPLPTLHALGPTSHPVFGPRRVNCIISAAL